MDSEPLNISSEITTAQKDLQRMSRERTELYRKNAALREQVRVLGSFVQEKVDENLDIALKENQYTDLLDWTPLDIAIDMKAFAADFDWRDITAEQLAPYVQVWLDNNLTTPTNAETEGCEHKWSPVASTSFGVTYGCGLCSDSKCVSTTPTHVETSKE